MGLGVHHRTNWAKARVNSLSMAEPYLQGSQKIATHGLEQSTPSLFDQAEATESSDFSCKTGWKPLGDHPREVTAWRPQLMKNGTQVEGSATPAQVQIDSWLWRK